MIRAGDEVRLLPGFQDPGDDAFQWYALEDEDGGRVLVETRVPGMALSPTSRMKTEWLTKA